MISKYKLMSDLIDVYSFFTQKVEIENFLDEMDYDELKLWTYYNLTYGRLYKYTYECHIANSIQVKTAEIHSYLKEHYHIVYFMLYGKPSFEEFKEHHEDLGNELFAMIAEATEMKI